MFTKRKFRVWFIVCGSSLGVLGMLLLLQRNTGKQSINTLSPSSTAQIAPDTQRRIKPPSTMPPAVKTPQQGTKTDLSQSENQENAPKDTDVPNTATPLDEEETIHSLVDSLSEKDIEVLEGLSFRDFLSDEDLKKLNRKTIESLKEFEEIVPEIVEQREKLREIIAYTNDISKQENWLQDKEKFEEVVKNDELIREMSVELRTLKSRASFLESFLLKANLHSIGPQIEEEWIRRLGSYISEPLLPSE